MRCRQPPIYFAHASRPSKSSAYRSSARQVKTIFIAAACRRGHSTCYCIAGASRGLLAPTKHNHTAAYWALVYANSHKKPPPPPVPKPTDAPISSPAGGQVQHMAAAATHPHLVQGNNRLNSHCRLFIMTLHLDLNHGKAVGPSAMLTAGGQVESCDDRE